MQQEQIPLLGPEPPWLADLLAALAKHEYLGARQLARLLGRGVEDVAAVLERLVAEGQLNIIEQPTTGAKAFTLAIRGAKLLGELTGQDPPSVRRRPRPYQLSHELAKNDLAVSLKLLDARGGPRFLSWETARDKLADAVHVMRGHGRPARIPLVADALAIVDAGDGPTALLVEIDMATVPLSRMRTKFEGYAAWYRLGGPERRFGTKSLRVLTLAKHDARMVRLRHAAGIAAGSGEQGFLWFGTLDCLDIDKPEKLLAKVFTTARPDEDRRHLFEGFSSHRARRHRSERGHQTDAPTQPKGTPATPPCPPSS